MLTRGFCYTTPRIKDLNGCVYCARLSSPFLRMLRGLESTSKSFLMPSIAMELPQFIALLLDSQPDKESASPMSLPVFLLRIILFASITLSRIPELTPKPAIGWIECAASPIRARRCFVQFSAWRELKGKAKRLLTSPFILPIGRQDGLPAWDALIDATSELRLEINCQSLSCITCSKSASCSDHTMLMQLFQRGRIPKMLESWQIWQAEVLSFASSPSTERVQAIAF